jgi:hypothetical protein
MWIEEK